MGVSTSELIPLLISGAAATASYVNKNQAMDERQSILAQAMDRNAELRDSAQEKTNALLDKITSMQSQDFAQPIDDSLNSVVYQPDDRLSRAFQTPGNVSSRYTSGAQQAEDTAQQYAGDVAGYLAARQGPGRQAFARTLSTNQYANDLDELTQQMRDQQSLTRLRLQDAQADPLIGALAQFAQGYAGSYGGDGGGMSFSDWLKKREIDDASNGPYAWLYGGAGL